MRRKPNIKITLRMIQQLLKYNALWKFFLAEIECEKKSLFMNTRHMETLTNVVEKKIW